MKVLLVDDEYSIREGLREMIQQCVIPGVTLEIVGTAVDGTSALDFLNNQDVDLLITDVRMPKMDGLQLLERVQTRYPDIRTIILSGFDEFAFVQQALRNGVIDYLLKPVQKEDITSAISRLVKINQKGNKETYLNWSQFNEKKGWKAIVVADLDDLQSSRAREFGDEQTLTWVLRKSSMEIMQEMDGVYFLSEQNKLDTCNIIYGITGELSEDVMKRIQHFESLFTIFWSEQMRVSVSLGVSLPFQYNQGEEIPYMEALSALFSRLFYGSGTYFTGTNEVTVKKADVHYIQQLLASLNVRDFDRVIGLIHDVVEEQMKKGGSAEMLLTIEKLLITLHQWTREIASPTIPLNVRQVVDLLIKLSWSRSKNSLLHTFDEWVNSLFLLIDPEGHEGQILLQAKKYIREHMKESITLGELSNATFISRSHLSRLFRKNTGQTFIEYLTELRIKEAMKLLMEPGIKIYEVAEQLGYRDWKHFSRSFKEHTGYNPAEYRTNQK